jgi:hypothetical protein
MRQRGSVTHASQHSTDVWRPGAARGRSAAAVGHAILIIAYHLLQRGTDYQDLGPGYFEQRDRDEEQRRLVHRLERLGYKVSLEPSAALPGVLFLDQAGTFVRHRENERGPGSVADRVGFSGEGWAASPVALRGDHLDRLG